MGPKKEKKIGKKENLFRGERVMKLLRENENPILISFLTILCVKEHTIVTHLGVRKLPNLCLWECFRL